MNFNIPSALSSRPETIWKLHRLTSPCCRQLSGPKSGDFNRKKSGFNHQKFGFHHQKWGCICICQWCLSRNEISFVKQKMAITCYHSFFQVSSSRSETGHFPYPSWYRGVRGVQYVLFNIHFFGAYTLEASHIVMKNLPFPYIHRSCSWRKKNEFQSQALDCILEGL